MVENIDQSDGEIKYEIYENSWAHVFQIAPQNRPLLVNIHEKFIRKKGRQQAILTCFGYNNEIQLTLENKPE